MPAKMITQKNVNLTDVLAPSFYPFHKAVREGLNSSYWLKGGRGSTKSSAISVEIILGMEKDPNANAVVLRKVAETLRESVYEQMLWAIDILGLTDEYHASVKPLRITKIKTGQRIIFKGAEKPKKVKASKFRRGYAKFIWYEEVDEFNSMAELRTITQFLGRGGSGITLFYSYNPPESNTNWVNIEVEQQKLRDEVFVHHSDYLTVPQEWLGELFIQEAEHLKKVNKDKYDHEYMGLITGTGAEVFKNITVRVITDEEIASFDKIHRGMDHGYAGDPMHFTKNYFDSTRRKLYIFAEVHKTALSNLRIVEEIRKVDPENGIITADSAEPRTNNELRDLGLRITGAKKGPGSIEHGMKFLQDLEEIIIDPYRCPNTKREFTTYELERDNNGNLKGNYPDHNNHSIDASRYSLEDVFTNRVAKVKKKPKYLRR
ncbi:PBSX family phage terminase large subunit [Enterococcus pallens]|uniref:PBSX family phage terminase, large subunit n=1 Tax=Enterococcus pallens ATCC BAA-351 TaxID=1158607 RepID=R2SHR9_9ENTE|nr:PBSX family phage terminase large subunit [Enterococcus pallens]EOH94825.1 PBSX family phage terminase, large subunit [Enterococcus pallens ATCC BAA-351]EOU14856.1 PBSX family phage terminase, large subunit [Enterococcus pallens ATCC BAA-351]OJG76229.1 PBSX family phage terminase, large subunit [Enterococcus pallens]